MLLMRSRLPLRFEVSRGRMTNKMAAVFPHIDRRTGGQNAMYRKRNLTWFDECTIVFNRAMDFSVDAPVGAKGDAIQKEQVMEQVKAQIAVANAQELLQKKITLKSNREYDYFGNVYEYYYFAFWTNVLESVRLLLTFNALSFLFQKMTDKCYRKCIHKPGTSLDNSEQAISHSIFQKCIAMCMDRYMDAWNLVSRTYTQRLQKERSRIG
ncbi:hypothetical protein LSH36_306g01050 [Paralvinella palmiformis]|uniref:Tim10-like domain-containing protein n=1 Tax=Paralvinella palmiformis TaxID=53620 RepID=A0AAD9JHK8_9ANNE|nr:hypothetical protein LSH36_306g01050 [Paralvinella palmiformis]